MLEDDVDVEDEIEWDDDEVEAEAGVPVAAPATAAVDLTKAADDYDDLVDDDEEDGPSEPEPEPEPAWTPRVGTPPRRRPSGGPGDYLSRGQAEIASFMPPGYGGKLAPPAPPPPPSAAPPQRDSKPSAALLAIAMAVVVATLATLGFLLVGQDDKGGDTLTAASGDASATTTPPTTTPGRDMSTIWKLDGYRLADGDPSIATEMRAEFEATPLLKSVFRDVQVKEVTRNGNTALALAFTVDPSVSSDAGWGLGFFAGIKGSVGSTTDTTVSGLKSVWVNDYPDVKMLVTPKKDVILMVGADTKANAEAIMVKLLANIT